MISIRNNEDILKIAVLGEGSVGKTTISKKFTNELKDSEVSMTKGVDIAIKELNYKENPVTLQIWDFAGQKQFRFMIDTFLRGTKGIMYVFDVTDIETLSYLDEFVNLAREYLKANNYPPVPEILVGNKVDLGDSEVTDADIDSFTKEHNISHCYLTSGIYGDNVSEPFEFLLENILDEDNSLIKQISKNLS